MTRPRLVAWFAVVLVVAVVSRLTLPGARAERCRLDGVRIIPVYRVDLVRDRAIVASFCCIRCAREWPDVPAGAYWQVHDEMTGEPLDATTACFVESEVVTVPSRQDRTHVFRSWADALGHASEYHGHRIANPLALEAPSRPGPSTTPDRRNPVEE